MFAFLQKQLTHRSGDIWMLSAKWLTPALTMVGGLIAARNLKPEELGVVQAVMLIPTYVMFLQFGVFNGLNRNLPMYRARGEYSQAQRFVNASAKAARWVACISAIIALMVVVISIFQSELPQFTYVACFLIPALFFAPLKLHQNTIYRGMREFGRLGKNLHITNLWILLCSVSTSVFGITALAVKIATSNLVGWLLMLRNPPLKEGKEASWSEIRTLSVVGLPMLISGLIFNWLAAADRTIIATFMTAEDLGYFALAGIVINALRVFPDSINQLLYPRIAHAYGKHGSSRCLRRFIWIGLILNLSLLLPVALLGYFVLPFLVEQYLPAYVLGIPAAQVTLVGSVAFVYAGPGAIIPIVRRNLPAQVMGVFSIALIWCGGTYAVFAGYGIVGVAVARVTATGLYGLFIVGFAYYLTAKNIAAEA